MLVLSESFGAMNSPGIVMQIVEAACTFRMQDGFHGIQAGIGNRARWKARVQVRIERRINLLV